MKKVIESVTYESPKAEVLLVTSEGVLCTSDVLPGENSSIFNPMEQGDDINF